MMPFLQSLAALLAEPLPAASAPDSARLAPAPAQATAPHAETTQSAGTAPGEDSPKQQDQCANLL